MKKFLLFLVIFFQVNISFAQNIDAEKIAKEYQAKIMAAKTLAEKQKLIKELQDKLNVKDAVKQATELAKLNPQSAQQLYQSSLCNKYKAAISFTGSNTTSDNKPNASCPNFSGNSTTHSQGNFTLVANLCNAYGQYAMGADEHFLFSSAGGGSSSYNGTESGCGSSGSKTFSNQFSYDTHKKPTFSFSYRNENEWNISFDATTVGTTINDGKTTPDEHSSIGFNANNTETAKCIFDGKKFIVSGNIREDLSRPEDQYKDISTVEFNVTIEPVKSSIDAVLEPVDGWDVFTKWLPKGRDMEHPEVSGNWVNLKVYLLEKERPNVKVTNKIKQVRYYFQDDEISRQPGFAMNEPYKDASTLADLQLGSTADAPDTTKEVTELITTATEIKIESFDYGAFGKLRADVTLDDGTVLNAISLKTNQPYVSIPIDNNNNHIADEWERQEGVFSNNYAATWDEDFLPKDLGDHNGDGYTIYEEYRGFIANKKHFRSSAKAKDLMVCDMIEERAKDGIAMFKDVTHINVHDDFKLEEFGRETDDLETEGMTRDKCLNFNSTPETHSVDQHGVAMIKSIERLGYAQAVTKDEKSPLLGTPKAYKYLKITLDFDPGPGGYNVVKGNLQPDKTVSGGAGNAKIITDNYARCVAHEMLHCCNVYHHGDIDIGLGTLYDCKDAKKLALDPNFNPNDNTYCLLADGTISVIKLYRSDDKTLLAPNGMIEPKGLEVYVGVNGGQHSGVEDCLMRYNSASIYKTTADKYYWIMSFSGKEMGGINLCISPKGTGVNAGNDPRYGDATLGNCKHQFCINDKYH